MAELAYLSLGSNLGDRATHLRTALRRLTMVGRVLGISSFYETAPVDVTDQPWFLNCVVVLETGHSPRQLLERVLAIEQALGRRRMRDKGPRTIDIDILLYGDRMVDEPGLKIPHPAMQRRRFVLEPLVEIAPELIHPVLKKTVRQLWRTLPADQSVQRRTPESEPPRT